MTEESKAQKFTISLHDNGYYCVSIPNYRGGSVVSAEAHDKEVESLLRTIDTLNSQKQTQAESLSTCHARMKLQKEAIEAAEALIVKLYDEEAIPMLMQYEVDGVRAQLKNSITPKGEKSS